LEENFTQRTQRRRGRDDEEFYMKGKTIKIFLLSVIVTVVITGCLDLWHPLEDEGKVKHDDTYTVSFSVNGGNGTPPNPVPQKKGGEEIYLPNAESLSKADHTFGGWNVSAAGDGINYFAGSPFTVPNKDITLYARWELVGIVTIPVSAVSLNKASLSLTAGESETLIATVTPTDATNKNVSWGTSNSAVATVSNGIVSAKSFGSTMIIVIALADGNISATCAVSVSPVSVTGVSMNKDTLILDAGGMETLTATVSPSDATNKGVSWTSSAPSVATVSSNGTVTGVSAGSAIITTTTIDGNKTATCSVTVSVTPANLASYLATLSSNTVSRPHNIALKVSNTGEFSTIKTTLNSASNKYVYLNLSGSTITAIPEFAFVVTTPINEYSSSIVGCATLTGVTIPGSITSIGVDSFATCENLASVTIQNGVNSIENGAFYGCWSLANVTIPDSVTKIGMQAFENCITLVSVTFQGTILSSRFAVGNTEYTPFPGDLLAKFYAMDSIHGTPGTYTRAKNSETWTRQ
jgi:uncharacterized repeat protein (TIGR02543 family)